MQRYELAVSIARCGVVDHRSSVHSRFLCFRLVAVSGTLDDLATDHCARKNVLEVVLSLAIVHPQFNSVYAGRTVRAVGAAGPDTKERLPSTPRKVSPALG